MISALLPLSISSADTVAITLPTGVFSGKRMGRSGEKTGLLSLTSVTRMFTVAKLIRPVAGSVALT